MSTKTSNYNLIKPSPEDFYNIEDQNKNMDVIDEKLHEVEGKVNNVDEELKRHIEDYERLSDTISSGAIHTTSLNLGMNRIHIPEVSVSPTIEFEGFSYVNLLGKDGNCEDLSKWYTYQSILSLDTLNKVFGNNCIKVIAASNYLTLVNRTNLKSHIAGKKIFVSLYIKTNATEQIRVDIRNLGTEGGSAYNKAVNINSTPTMTRVGLKLDLSDSADYDLYLWIVKANPTAATEMYVDGVMVIVIDDNEYNNLSIEDLLAKYPYVDSYGCLINPCFENRRYNLIRNGNCEEGTAYWKPGSASVSLSVVDGKLRVTGVATTDGRQTIKVKPNTHYYLSGNVVSGTGTGGVLVISGDGSTALTSSFNSSFNTGNNSEIIIRLRLASDGYADYSSIMLIEGTEPPTEYRSCDIRRFVVEGQFTKDDKVKIENGKVSGVLNWKHRTLFGKDYGWNLSEGTYVGFKKINAYIPHFVDNFLVTKYDGKILPFYDDSTQSGDQVYNTPSLIEIWINNTDSGWNDSINPNSDERKAYMNGWKAVNYNAYGRYIAWVSIVDGKPPAGIPQTTIASNYTAGSTSLVVVDASKFVVGDWITILFDNGGYSIAQITAISGNTLTITTGANLSAAAGNVVFKNDGTSTSGGQILEYCKNNVAPGYEGYRLHYKLANPEPITDANVHIKGEIWDLVKGDNYVTVDSGIVLGEVANPFNNGTNVVINSTYTGESGSSLRNPIENINTVYRNEIFDAYFNSGTVLSGSANGKYKISIPSANYDTNATYTVDYQILKTLHAQTFGSLSLSYKQGIISTLESHSKSLEQKQNKDCSLDTLIDLSVYEEFKTVTVLGRPAHLSYIGPMFYLDWSFTPKRVKPLVTFRNIDMAYYDSSGNRTPIELRHLQIGIMYLDRRHIRVYGCYIGKDSTIINALRENGGYLMFDLVLDCRGRI